MVGDEAVFHMKQVQCTYGLESPSLSMRARFILFLLGTMLSPRNLPQLVECR
jgi:hypothetical protein